MNGFVRQDPESCPSAAIGWLSVFIMLFLYIVSLLDRNLLSLLMPDIQRDLGLSDVDSGILYGTAFALFYAIGALPLGTAVDRYDRRVVIWFGVSVWSIGTALCGFARSFGGLFAARAIVGAGEAVLAPGSHSMLADLFPRHKLTFPMSVYASGAKVGAGASLVLGGLLISIVAPSQSYQVPLLGQMMGWHLIFVVTGLPGLLLGLIIFVVPEKRHRKVNPDAATTYRDYWRFVRNHWRFIVPHHLAFLPLAIISIGIQAWTPTFLARVHEWPMQQAGLWLGIAIAAGPALTLPIHGMIADRLFKRGVADIHLRYMVIALLIALPFGVAAFLVDSATLSVVLVGLFLGVMSGFVSLPATLLQFVVPATMRGKATSVQLTLTSLVSIGVGPVVVALLTEKLFGDPMKVGLSLALCAAIGAPLSALLYSLAMQPARRMLDSCGAPSSVVGQAQSEAQPLPG